MEQQQATFQCGKASIPIRCDGICKGSSHDTAVGTNNSDIDPSQTSEGSLNELLADQCILARLKSFRAPDAPTPSTATNAAAISPAEATLPATATASSTIVDVYASGASGVQTGSSTDVYTELLGSEPPGTWAKLLVKCKEHQQEVNEIVSNTRCATLSSLEKTRLENVLAIANYMCSLNEKDPGQKTEGIEECKKVLQKTLQEDPENLLALMHLCRIENDHDGNHEVVQELANKYVKAKKKVINELVCLTEQAYFYSMLNPFYYSLSLSIYSQAHRLLQDTTDLSPSCTLRILYLFTAIGFATTASKYAENPAPNPSLPPPRFLQFERIFADSKRFLRNVCCYYDKEPPYNARAWITWSSLIDAFNSKLPKYLEPQPDSGSEIFRVTSDELTREDQSEYFKLIECRALRFGPKLKGCRTWREAHPSPQSDPGSVRDSHLVPTESLPEQAPEPIPVVICSHQLPRLATLFAIMKCEVWDAFTLSRIANNLLKLRMNNLDLLKLPEIMQAIDRYRRWLDEQTRVDTSTPAVNYLPRPLLQHLQLHQNQRNRNYPARPVLSSYLQHAEVYTLLSLHVRRGGMSLHKLVQLYVRTCTENHSPSMPSHLVDKWFAGAQHMAAPNERIFNFDQLLPLATRNGM